MSRFFDLALRVGRSLSYGTRYELPMSIAYFSHMLNIRMYKIILVKLIIILVKLYECLSATWWALAPFPHSNKVSVSGFALLHLTSITYSVVLIALLRCRNNANNYYDILHSGYLVTEKRLPTVILMSRILAFFVRSKILIGAMLHYLNKYQKYDVVVSVCEKNEKLCQDHFCITPVRLEAHFHQGSHRRVVSLFEDSELSKDVMRQARCFGLAGVSAALLRRWDLVHLCYANEAAWNVAPTPGIDFLSVWHDVQTHTENFLSCTAEAKADVVGRNDSEHGAPKSQVLAAAPDKTLNNSTFTERHRVVIFQDMPHMLGHALHEPFFLMALTRDQVDQFVFIGSPRENYLPGPRVALELVEQHGRYVETEKLDFKRLCHADLGQYLSDGTRYIAMHNWSITRQFVLRGRDREDDFKPYQWTMDVPSRIKELGESFCSKHGIPLDQPIVTVHVRDDAYHGIARQALRSADVKTYMPAISWLLAQGYTVVRLGDTKMPRLEVDASGNYFELPFAEDYSAGLDAYFVSVSRFMIAAPSGPIAYSIALGVPTLCANAIHNFLHAPGKQEMACFKRYVETASGRELSMEEILEKELFFDVHKPELDAKGVSVLGARPDELLAATRDIDAWVSSPNIPLTGPQKSFRQIIDEHANNLLLREPSDLPIADFLGHSMPHFRISPSVAEIRGDFNAK